MTRPTPKQFFTMEYLRSRRDDRPPPTLFHWTRTIGSARSILRDGYIGGRGTVHLTENPALIEAGSIGWLLDTVAILRLGFHLYPTQHSNWPHEGEWTVGAPGSERLGEMDETEGAIWSQPARLPLDAVARRTLVRPHMLGRHPELLGELRRQSPVPVEEFEWDVWWESCPLPVARNPLLAKPPTSVHRLTNTTSFRRLFGRPPRQSDYDGVHTTGSRLIAAAYAMGTWDNGAGYPVIVTLDVSGLKALPDVDAMLRGAEAVADDLPEYRKLVKDGESFHALLNEYDFGQSDARAGEEPSVFIFEGVGTHVLNAIGDEPNPKAAFAKFIKTGDLPNSVLMRMVNQQRYLNDFDIDRVGRTIVFA